MSSQKKHSFICRSCGKTVMLSDEPICCPFCGSYEFRRNTEKAKHHADEVIAQMNELAPKVEEAWKAYVSAYVEFENKRRLISTYVQRGIVDKKCVPTVEKKNLTEELYAYRKARMESND